MDYRERWELKDYRKRRTLWRRILLFQAAVTALLAAFVLDFWYLQGVRSDEFARLAETNRLRQIPEPATRGVIFDRHDRLLASTRPSLDLVLLREDHADLELQLERLAPILGVSSSDLLARKAALEKKPAFAPMVLTEDVDLAQLARIEARREQFPSVEVREGVRRSYPDGPAVAHLLGYVGEASEEELLRTGGNLRLGDIVGKAGLERGYDELLRGQRGWNFVTVNNVGRRMSDAWVGREPEHGEDIHLTIDLDLQRALIAALGDERGAGVFLDPWTGEVLAIGSTPAYDPNRFADGLSADDWRRLADDPSRPLLARAIASRYAPGSTFKVIMAIAGLERHIITPEQTVFCGGSTTIYGDRRLCWKRGGHGKVNLHEALVHSCNVYFYQLGRDLGIDPIHDYGSRFGLGESTGIDLPGEVAGILPSRAWKQERYGEAWFPGDTISVAIGQGLIALTPVQAARMIGAVATSGVLTHPHLLAGRGVPPSRLDVSPETFRVVRQALHSTVEQGTATAADLGSISVAGKTGTAQVYRHSAGVDSDKLPKSERDHAWFVGYAPAERPTIAFAIVVEHGGHGGSAAAPVARAVLEVFFSRELREDQRRRAGAGEAGGHVRAAAAR